MYYVNQKKKLIYVVSLPDMEYIRKYIPYKYINLIVN